MNKQNPYIVLGVTGSIAAYKACELTRLCIRRGWPVSVIQTKAATRFVSELTFRTLSQNPVAVDMFEQPDEWNPGHIGLADRASVFVIAPCTANVIAKIANGIADDMLSSTVLATRAPLLIAPAMNIHMWDNPATRSNIATLRKRGAIVMDAADGDLACGYQGKGRMPEPADIMREIDKTLRGEPRTG